MTDARPSSAAQDDPDVSIVVPVYNGASTIAACIASLLALDFPAPRREIIVVDNGSTDATREILLTFGDDVHVVHEAKRGAAAARNRGIRAARAARIAFTDGDCEVEAGWLGAMIAPLDDPTVGVVGGMVLSVAGGNRIERFGQLIHDQEYAILHDDEPYVLGASWAARADVLLQCGLFDETLLRGHDVEFAWRIRRAGFRLAYAPTARSYHHNQRTLRGLMHEGFVHGFKSIRLLQEFEVDSAFANSKRFRSLRRFAGDLRRLSRGGNVIDAFLWLVFNFGKTRGERAGRRAARKHS